MGTTTGKAIRSATKELSRADLRPRPRRSESIKLRVTQEQKESVQAVAADLGMTVSDLIVQVVEHALPKLSKRARA